jgi:predicted dehydrogenase
MNRREVLTITGAAALSIGAKRILGANDRVRMAIVGLGGRGSNHLSEYLELAGADVAGLCDVNQAALEKSQATIARKQRPKAKEYGDMRKVFEDKDIDAVSIATPNHWHALSAIWAMQAGKDAYCEKPASHNPFESQQMIAAARKYGRMCQIGSQSRSMPHKMEAMQLLKEGVLGKIYLAKGLCYKRRKSIGKRADEPTPPGVNWDLFLGPAPLRPFNQLRFAYNWHWFWDTGNGDMGNQGVHEMDVARWGLGLPNSHMGLKSVSGTGGKFQYDDDQETPNTQTCTFDYGDRQLVFETRGLVTGGEGGLQVRGGNTIGNLFYGVDGWMAVDGNGYTIYKGEKHEVVKEVKRVAGQSETGAHMDNFLAAVKSRNYKSLHAEIEIGAAAADLCHFGNIAYRAGRSLAWDNTKKEFSNAPDANKMMTREYRRPYVVPAKV